MHVKTTQNGNTLRSNEISRQHKYIMISFIKRLVVELATAVKTLFDNLFENFDNTKKNVQTSNSLFGWNINP